MPVSGFPIVPETIFTSLDFPYPNQVVTARTQFLIMAPVTDNNPTRTNTGQSFTTDDYIVWNGSAWDNLGSGTPAPVAADDVSFVPYSYVTATNVQEAIEQVADKASIIDGEVNTFGDLPPASTHSGETYYVKNWSVLNPTKLSGLYLSDGVNWNRRSDKVLYSLAPFGAAGRFVVTDDTGRQVTDLAIAPTDGNFIVGNGTTWVAESGNTARTSLGVGEGDSPTWTAVNLVNGANSVNVSVGSGGIAFNKSSTVASTGFTSSVTRSEDNIGVIQVSSDTTSLSGNHDSIFTSIAWGGGDAVTKYAVGTTASRIVTQGVNSSVNGGTYEIRYGSTLSDGAADLQLDTSGNLIIKGDITGTAVNLNNTVDPAVHIGVDENGLTLDNSLNISNSVFSALGVFSSGGQAVLAVGSNTSAAPGSSDDAVVQISTGGTGDSLIKLSTNNFSTLVTHGINASAGTYEINFGSSLPDGSFELQLTSAGDLTAKGSATATSLNLINGSDTVALTTDSNGLNLNRSIWNSISGPLFNLMQSTDDAAIVQVSSDVFTGGQTNDAAFVARAWNLGDAVIKFHVGFSPSIWTAGNNNSVTGDPFEIHAGDGLSDGNAELQLTTAGDLIIKGNITATGGSISGNASTATKLATARTIAITGDLAYTSPSFDGSANVTAAGTLATVNSNVGSFGSATQTGTFTVNGKGLITAASNVTITPAVGSITGLGTGIATFLATPSSANLLAAITDETGSGALVFGTSPTIATPAITGNTTISGNLTMQSSVSGTKMLNLINNSTASGTDNASIGIASGGPTAGDPYLYFDIATASGMSYGLDNSDGDSLKATDTIGGVSSGNVLSKLDRSGNYTILGSFIATGGTAGASILAIGGSSNGVLRAAGSTATEGGQTELGYIGNTSMSGNDARWVNDIEGSNNMRVYRVNGAGVSQTIVTYQEATGVANFAVEVNSPLISTNAASGTGTALIIDASNRIRPLTSSERFKENIKAYEMDILGLSALELIEYNYKETGDWDIGLSAERAAEVYPLIVNYRDDKPYSINFPRLTLALLEAYNKLEAKVSQLTH
jgi:hypothetical protein